MSKIYDDPKYNAAFDRCIDVMTKLMLKYGKQVWSSTRRLLLFLCKNSQIRSKAVLLLTLLKSLQFTRCVIVGPML